MWQKSLIELKDRSKVASIAGLKNPSSMSLSLMLQKIHSDVPHHTPMSSSMRFGQEYKACVTVLREDKIAVTTSELSANVKVNMHHINLPTALIFLAETRSLKTL